MGFYIRKSVKAGPFRFNLSKSGIGVSAGIPGFRIGTGPRGNYVHMGRNGVYYRASLGGDRAGSSPRLGQPNLPRQPAFRPSEVVMEDVTGATAMSLEPTGRGDLVDQLNAAAARFAWWWPTLVVVLLLGLVTMPWGLIIWALGGAGCIWLNLNDQARRTVVLFYDVHDDARTWFDSLVTQWRWLTESQRVWRIIQAGDVTGTHSFKVNAGASALVNRINAAASTSGKIKHLATNIAVPSITAGNSALYLLPDRLVVRDGKRYGDIDYQALRAFHQTERFIETSPLPGDSVQVDSTWQYVNVKGGPDRRFANNRMLPIMRYGRLIITSDSGLYWIIQTSRPDAAGAVAQAMSAAPAEPAARSVTNIAPAAQPDSEEKRTKVRCYNCRNVQQAPVGASTFRCEKCKAQLRRANKKTSPPATPSSLPVAAPPATAIRTQQQHPKPTQRPSNVSGAITRSLLTRAVTDCLASGQVFAAIDLETTGLFPMADRIVEIGVVKFRGDGEILDEFATLVNNPGSSPGAKSHHQIEDEDLIGAPTIDHVLPEIFAFMSGTVVVAHNLDFEEGFLASAAQRNGLSLPRLTGVCTLQAARRQLDSRAYSLISLYKSATGQWAEAQHTALGDARAVREVLLWMLRTAPKPLHLTVGATPVPTPAVPRPCEISCRPMPMTRASVAALLRSFPQSSTPRRGDSAEIERYRALLDDCVEDGRLTFEEAAALSAQARRTRLSGTQLRSLHREAWKSAFGEDADTDWAKLDSVRRREMWLLADALGLPDLTNEIGDAIERRAEPMPPPQARYLRGVRVGILGHGPELDLLRGRAAEYGASIAVRITQTVIWVATTTPNATDAPHRAARTHRVPILSPSVAKARLNDAIRAAELRDFERQRAIDEWDAQRQLRDEYWRPKWRPTELDYDPEPLYNN